MPREIADADTGITWTCIQAFAGLGDGDAGKTEAARVKGGEDRFHVVCTPSGGARSARLELAGHWKAELSDEHLIEAIRAKLAEDG